MIFRVFILIVFSTLLFCSACKHDPVIEPEVLPCGEAFEGVSYAMELTPVFETYCYNVSGSSCHIDEDAPGDFSQYDDIFTFRLEIEERVIDLMNMPPDYSPGLKDLDDCELAKLSLWLEKGANEN